MILLLLLLRIYTQAIQQAARAKLILTGCVIIHTGDLWFSARRPGQIVEREVCQHAGISTSPPHVLCEQRASTLAASKRPLAAQSLSSTPSLLSPNFPSSFQGVSSTPCISYSTQSITGPSYKAGPSQQRPKAGGQFHPGTDDLEVRSDDVAWLQRQGREAEASLAAALAGASGSRKRAFEE